MGSFYLLQPRSSSSLERFDQCEIQDARRDLIDLDITQDITATAKTSQEPAHCYHIKKMHFIVVCRLLLMHKVPFAFVFFALLSRGH